MLEVWKKQISIKKFGLTHEDPLIFLMSQWQSKSIPNLYYLLYRWAVGIFFVISMIFSILDLKHPNQSAEFRVKWLIYLTSWGFTICTIQSLISVCMLTNWFFKSKGSKEESLQHLYVFKFYKLYWVVNTIATDIAFGVTVIYWSLIYDETKMGLDAMNIIVHVGNSVVMLIDLWMVAHPINILHFHFPVLFGLCYVIFSVLYYLAGGRSREANVYIYPILDWSNPGKTVIVCVLVTLFVIFLHCLAYGTFRTRKYISSKLINIEKNSTANEKYRKESYNNPAMVNDVV